MRSETDPSLFAILDSVSNGCCVIRESGEVVFWKRKLNRSLVLISLIPRFTICLKKLLEKNT